MTPLFKHVKALVRRSPLLTLYAGHIFTWRHHKKIERLCKIYSPFVRKDDLVFDVGANVGLLTRVFLSLGARVVAVEPLDECARGLRAAGPPNRLKIEHVALGAEEGTSFLYVNQLRPTLTTLSPKWVDIAKHAGRFQGEQWHQQSIRVRVTTLDLLIEKYGRPSFIKIDVEGYESEVLRGMRSLVCPLNFEFNSEWMAATEACLGSGCFRQQDVEYAFLPADAPSVLGWFDEEGLRSTLRDHVTGDIFVKPRRHSEVAQGREAAHAMDGV